MLYLLFHPADNGKIIIIILIIIIIIIKIHSFVHLNRFALINFYKVIWNTLTKQFIIKPTS